MPLDETPPLKPEFEKSVEGAPPKRRAPYSLRLSSVDRERLEHDRGFMSLAAYIRWRLFDPDRPPPRHRGNAPVKDQHALSSLLAQLGQSRLSNNLNQLARAVNTGSLPVSISAFERAIEEVETANGLTGQPRMVVFHEKDGRRHAHCVWSRIDADTMTARPLPFFKNKLREVSKGLYLEHGWRMPMGLIDSSQRDPLNFNLAEWQQAKREGNDPRALKALLQECWAASDSASAFEQSLKERGIHLAAGDRRSFVVVDFQGEVHSLPRALGLKTKDVAARLGNASLKPVETVRADVSARMTTAIKRHITDARTAFQERSKTLGDAKRNMAASHRADRATLKDRQRDQWDEATRERASRLPRGIKALWWRLTGQYKETRARNEGEAKEQRETQRAERERMIARQLEERRALKTQEKSLRTEQADRLKELRRDVGRFLGLSRGRDAPRSQQRGHGLGLKLER